MQAVFLPGGGGDAVVWHAVAQQLGYRTDAAAPDAVFIDYPGLGPIPIQDSIRSTDDLYDYVLERLPARCDLFARSMGGVLALKLAIEHPERIRALVLTVPAGGIDVLALGAEDWRPAWTAKRPTAPRYFVDDRSDFTASLSKIVAPTLVVCGDRDPLSPVAVGEFLAARIPTAKFEVVADATHDLTEEQSAVLARLIERHLADAAGATA